MYSKAYFEITNVCNKNCSFCPGTKREKKFVSIEEFNTVTDKLLGITKYLYLHIMGEPTLHPNIVDFIKIANEKGFFVTITTNASLIAKRGREMVDAGVYKVNLSVHSFENGSVSSHSEYINDCINFSKYALKKGTITVFRLWNNGGNDAFNDLTIDLIEKAFSVNIDKAVKSYTIKKGIYLEHGDKFTWPDLLCEEGDGKVFCYGLKDHFGILSNGTIVPCCLDREGVINLGNAIDGDILSALNGERAKKIRNGFKDRKAVEELCKKCPYARRF